MKKLGLYIHIPFCDKKCPYCDFYSKKCDVNTKNLYIDALCKDILSFSYHQKITLDTIYLGGGTPSSLSLNQVNKLFMAIYDRFFVEKNAEITMEYNPEHQKDFNHIKELQNIGINRISIGAQSAVFEELALLKRNHTKDDIKNLVVSCQNAGITNISLDYISDLPISSKQNIDKTLSFYNSLNVTHISCYSLKIAENTPFFKIKNKLIIDEDLACENYFHIIETLDKFNFVQYEISNFSKENFESRHNLKYWKSENTLAFGASAHYLLDDKLFSFDKDVDSYIKGTCKAQYNGDLDKDTFMTLFLRLTKGVSELDLKKHGFDGFSDFYKNTQTYEKLGLVSVCDGNIALTTQGFLVEQALIPKILYG